MFTRQTTAVVIFLLVGSFFCGQGIPMAAEVQFPTTPITILVGMKPGGGGDTCARMLAEISEKEFGQQVMVVNKPGGHNKVMVTMLSKAKPDGYTIGVSSDPVYVLSPLITKTLFTAEDFTYITRLYSMIVGTVVREDSPFHNLKDLFEFARKNPNTLKIATTGKGSSSHMLWEILAKMEGVKVNLVPFPGSAPAGAALLGGHVDASMGSSSVWAKWVKAKKVRPIFVNAKIPFAPDAPTLEDLGYSDIIPQTISVVAGPKNIEKPVLNKLIKVFEQAMDTPRYKQLLNTLGFPVTKPLSGEKFRKEIFRRVEIYKKIKKEHPEVIAIGAE